MRTKLLLAGVLGGVLSLSSTLLAAAKPNVMILFADDISAREFQGYGSRLGSYYVVVERLSKI